VGVHDNNPPDIDCCQQSRRKLTAFLTVVSTQVRLWTIIDHCIRNGTTVGLANVAD
jgi:hypothetical protein